jgi:hypothetical protein
VRGPNRNSPLTVLRKTAHFICRRNHVHMQHRFAEGSSGEQMPA